MEYEVQYKIEPVTRYQIKLYKIGREGNQTLLASSLIAECISEYQAECILEAITEKV